MEKWLMGHSSRTRKGEIRDALEPRSLKSLEEETAGVREGMVTPLFPRLGR
ncbi:hypothetical protein LEMLEM_LOCUS26184 [Lemmus lemmus]